MTQPSTDSPSEDTAKIVDLMRKDRTVMVGTVLTDGSIQSRPMSVQTVEDDGTLWFFAHDDGPLAEQLTSHPQVNVAFADSDHWVSLAGTARLEHSSAKIDELWDSTTDAFFPDGKETPGLTLIEVSPDSAEYWDQPGGGVGALYNFVKAKVTGGTYDGGTSGSTEL
ncbi:pyridoxamine 5'-phosphate oxidase family protein [Tersicoccus sp. Bi-70]|uniref:pyridoxamine 5'-phosphate oxidase family protein n=1 Tax=Tersicoccus sp. Bi-70 TaxID=1897634 RepID=UPI000975EB7B|nr:pyridoxamine 5'-phosphate oxidase family protein [Tersicoccus sp. Bi-70]OMH34379.1 hypothetical protein BGP79_04555 [Tersicoccus sp. Bi-70]